ncbi:MAG: MMPL family transporter [Actinoallomurus sp.]
MAALLYRLGRFSFHRRGRVVAVWVLLLGVIGGAALAFRGPTSSEFTMPGTESQQALTTLKRDFPQAGGATGTVVIASTGGQKLTATQVRPIVAQAAAVPGVVAATDPFQARAISADGRHALVQVQFAAPADAATEDAVHSIRAKAAGITGADVALTGTTAVGIDVSEKLADALPIYLLLVVGLSILLLMLVFRSVLVPIKAAAGFLLTVGGTFGITVAVFQEGHLAGLIGVDTPGPLISFLPVLLIGILFGLAMDYEVFLVSRMREDFVHGDTARQATINGLGHNARVVTAAALIMISVFSGFVLAPDPIIKSIGFALAVGVFIDAFIVRMTLVPAVMSLLGRAAWWLPRPLDRALPDLDIEGESLPDAPVPERSGATPPVRV